MANGIMSRKSKIVSGVPQGTVLGPICFLIMINTIDDNRIKSILSSFADDTKINHGIKSLDDAEEMQKDLEILYNWQNSNNMQFNDTKFQLLQFGKDKLKHNY